MELLQKLIKPYSQFKKLYANDNFLVRQQAFYFFFIAILIILLGTVITGISLFWDFSANSGVIGATPERIFIFVICGMVMLGSVFYKRLEIAFYILLFMGIYLYPFLLDSSSPEIVVISELIVLITLFTLVSRTVSQVVLIVMFTGFVLAFRISAQVIGITDDQLSDSQFFMAYSTILTFLVCLVAVGRNILVNVKLQDAIATEQKNRLDTISNIAGTISHEFNNQLCGIRSCAELLRTAVNSSPHSLSVSNEKLIEEYTSDIFQAVTHATELTAKLLGFAQDGKYRNLRVNVQDVLENCIRNIENSTGERITFVREYFASTPYVSGDPEQLKYALKEVLVNAVDAICHTGVITSRLEMVRKEQNSGIDRDAVVISIVDTGVGISEHNIHKILEPCFTTKSHCSRTGMGLPAVQGIVTNHSGKLDIQSSKNTGTTVILTFPLAEDSSVQSVVETVIEPLSLSGIQVPSTDGVASRKRVMVVDDEQVVRKTTTQIVERLGYEVISCPSGVDAIEYLEEKDHECIDLVILDLMMPMLSGAETFKEMQKIQSDIKVLIASGYSAEGEVLTMLHDGAKGFIQKPFEVSDLTSKIQFIINE